MDTFVSILTYLGLTPDKITPLLVLGIVGVFLIDKRIKPVENKFDKKFDKLERKFDKLEKFIVSLCAAISTKGDVDKLELYKTDSPVSLTEKGKEQLKKIGFTDDIDNNLEFILKEVDKLEPKSAFDVEQYCIGLITCLITDKGIKIFKRTEDYIYTHPEYNNHEYFKAAGLYVRDKYLEKHPELLPKNI